VVERSDQWLKSLDSSPARNLRLWAVVALGPPYPMEAVSLVRYPIGRARLCGVLRCRAAVPQGYSWTPTLSTG
jgi:hypothetical protein